MRGSIQIPRPRLYSFLSNGTAVDEELADADVIEAAAEVTVVVCEVRLLDMLLKGPLDMAAVALAKLELIAWEEVWELTVNFVWKPDCALLSEVDDVPCAVAITVRSVVCVVAIIADAAVRTVVCVTDAVCELWVSISRDCSKTVFWTFECKSSSFLDLQLPALKTKWHGEEGKCYCEAAWQAIYWHCSPCCVLATGNNVLYPTTARTKKVK
ncbi:hypothetical protein EJ03DRAFT_60575 [Teratosphaeria nubilosa]|uniref:Uncharacterized protein n=1 Tax=Teratosphaeria nubilosa TaxID=161662 RepID=A0A6G1LDZ7_9PEZI|nr:hypothetical protein EJ03DRAFT_60575 [Teratosphaeria nubilosa]